MTSTADRTGYLFAALTISLWSGFVIVSRIGGTSVLNPFDITALRFGTAAALLVPAWLAWKRVPLFTPRMLALALVGGIGYSLTVYAGFRHAPGAHGALLISGLLPFSLAFLVWVMLGESPSASLKRGLLPIAFGIACLGIDTARHGGLVLLGDTLLVTASLLWALYTILVRRWGYSPWETTIGVALLSSLLYLPVYALALPRNLDAAPWHDIALQAFYQGVLVVIVAMVAYMHAIERLGPARVGAMMAMVPALGGIGVSLALGEPLTGWLVAGLLLTSAGAFLGVRR